MEWKDAQPEAGGQKQPAGQAAAPVLPEETARLRRELSELQKRHQQALERIEFLEREKAEILGVLEKINHSDAYQLLKRFRSLRSRLLPPATRRRRWCDRLMKSVLQRGEKAAPQGAKQSRAGIAETPPDFYQAQISITEAFAEMRAGEQAEVQVRVKNASPRLWPGESSGGGAVRLSYHWQDEQGRMEQWEGERTDLGGDLAPGQTRDRAVKVFAPFRPGKYILEITLVQEGTAWFDQKGAAGARLAVQVAAGEGGWGGRPSCSIVIPVYNRAAFTRGCLLAIERSVPAELPHEIIVVDNGSVDQTPEILRRWSESRRNGRFFSMGANRGFARACNQGARLARGEFIVLLNNDTLPTPGWLERMAECAVQEPGAGVVGSKLLFPDGRIQHVGVVFDGRRNPRHIYRGLPSSIEPASKSREYQAVTGACLLIGKQLYASLNGLDESYQNSYEDVDLCMKARAQGYRVIFCADSLVYHFESLSPGRHDNDLKNLALFKARWGSRIESDADRWCQQDGVQDELTQYEPHAGYRSKQEKQIEAVWKKVYGAPFPGWESWNARGAG